MSENLAPPIANPNYHRAYENVGGAEIPENRIVKSSGAYPGCDLATDKAADTLLGVTVEAMGVGTMKSIQKDGRLRVEAGAAIARDDKITTDAQGRAITVALADDVVLGRAENAVSGAGEFVMVESEL